MANSLTQRFWAIVRCWRALPQVDTEDITQLVDFTLAHTIAPEQIRSELMQLAKIVQSRKPANILEIGTCSGGTLFIFCRLAAPNASIISVDLPRGRFGGGYSSIRIPLYKRFARPTQALRLIRADSHAEETLAQVTRFLAGKQLDFLFIDGDHTYDGVKKDFEMYSPLVHSGGLIALHDIAPHPRGWGGEVPRFWDEVKGKYKSNEIVADAKGGYGIGVLYA